MSTDNKQDVDSATNTNTNSIPAKPAAQVKNKTSKVTDQTQKNSPRSKETQSEETAPVFVSRRVWPD